MKTMTVSAKPESVKQDWYVVDASGKTLGRLATELARRLRGKHKPVFTPHVDTGDYLVVINAEKIHVTGNKLKDKMYHRFTGYIGNIKSETLGQALAAHPERVIETGVKGMLPKNWSSGLPLTTIAPLPGLRNTRAADDLRRPVP